jgi:hypothetical protein
MQLRFELVQRFERDLATRARLQQFHEIIVPMCPCDVFGRFLRII